MPVKFGKNRVTTFLDATLLPDVPRDGRPSELAMMLQVSPDPEGDHRLRRFFVEADPADSG